MKKLLYVLLIAAGAATAFNSCKKTVPDIPQGNIDDEDEKIEIPSAPAFTDEEGKYVSTIETNDNGKWVTIQYTGMGADGNIKNLSELIYMPEDTPTHLAIGCHITITSDSERPSNYKNISFLTDVGFLTPALASKGCLTVFPDYEGYGVSSSVPHPYLDRDITARQTIAGAKAALDWFENQQHKTMAEGWDGFSIGYSQGGAVAASVLRYYKEYNLDGLNLIGAICGDGPYDPLKTLEQYIKDDKLYMPVSAVLVLKGIVDTNKDMKALGCTYADFATQDLMDTQIFELIANKQSSTGQIHSHLLAHSKEKGGFTMMVYNNTAEDFLPYNATNTATYEENTWNLQDGKAKSYCTAGQCFKPGLIAYIKEGKVTGDIPEAKLKAVVNALKQNSLVDGEWKPENGSKQFLLFHSTRDEVVPFVNYESVIESWGEDSVNGKPFEDATNWTHLDTGTQFVLKAYTNFIDECIKPQS